jgi:hypothetical protein
MKISWDNIYLLGWQSVDGKKNLTAWHGKRPWIDVVVVGVTDNDMKHIMWSSPLHSDFQLINIPALTNPRAFAKMNDGLHAFGWYLEEGVKRPPNRPLVDEWAWLERLKGK